MRPVRQAADALQQIPHHPAMHRLPRAQAAAATSLTGAPANDRYEKWLADAIERLVVSD